MRNSFALLGMIMIFLSNGLVTGQIIQSNEIVGLWKSPEGKLMVKIDKIGNFYQGRIAWLSDFENTADPILDQNNPKPHLRNIPLKGNKIIRELSFDSANVIWDRGFYYDHAEGKHYNCSVKMLDPFSIQITRHLDGRSKSDEIWRRIQ